MKTNWDDDSRIEEIIGALWLIVGFLCLFAQGPHFSNDKKTRNDDSKL
jgi:hypothetical protein